MQIRKLFPILLMGLAIMCCSPVQDETEPRQLTPAQALIEGESKARVCMSCHGVRGVSRITTYPSLAGKPEAYLNQQLLAFRDGTRENPMMNAMAASLTDESIALLALYFSSQEAPIAND